MKRVQELFIIRSFKYCTANKSFLLLVVLLLMSLLFYHQHYDDLIVEILVETVILILVMGYGLQITSDIINHGKRLPKIMPKKIIKLGIKSLIITFIYFSIQITILGFIASELHFPYFELEEIVLDSHEIFNLFYTHDPVNTVFFIILSLIATYLTVFFMEMALAQMADGGKLINSFNPVYLTKIINKIGFRRYALDYTMVIISMAILTYINILIYDIPYVNLFLRTFVILMILVIEYGAIGLIYRESKE